LLLASFPYNRLGKPEIQTETITRARDAPPLRVIGHRSIESNEMRKRPPPLLPAHRTQSNGCRAAEIEDSERCGLITDTDGRDGPSRFVRVRVSALSATV